jgi:hypothetical protein
MMKPMKAFVFLLFSGLGFAQHSVTLNWVDNINPSGTLYNVYRLSGACPNQKYQPLGDFAKLTSAPLTAFTYKDLSVTAGDTYCYVVTAVSGSTESGPSGPAAASVPLVDPPELSKKPGVVFLLSPAGILPRLVGGPA